MLTSARIPTRSTDDLQIGNLLDDPGLRELMGIPARQPDGSANDRRPMNIRRLLERAAA